MEGDCNVYAHSSLWMRPTRPDRYNAKMVYKWKRILYSYAFYPNPNFGSKVIVT